MSSAVISIQAHSIVIQKGEEKIFLSLEEGLQLATELKKSCQQAQYQNKIERLSKYIDELLQEIPSGTFAMGFDNGDPWEGPSHVVELSERFLMTRTLISQNLYKLVMDENPSVYPGSEQPVDSVTWFDALRFCNRVSSLLNYELCYEFTEQEVVWHRDRHGFRLPTEAEWFWAAYGARDSSSLSLVPDEESQFLQPEFTHPPEACSGKPNSFGLFDMSGICFSWCFDSFGPFDMTRKKDPVLFHSSQELRVCRGGAWNRSKWYSRPHFRCGLDAQSQFNNVGFRIVRSIPK